MAAVGWVLLFQVLLLFTTPSGGFLWRRRTHWSSGSPAGYSYDTRYFTQKFIPPSDGLGLGIKVFKSHKPTTFTERGLACEIDHLNAGDERTFQQRYLINTDYWHGGAPIFLYTGNEGDITWFCNNTGFMWDIAPKYQAMLLFVEHRYYGNSLPFGKDSYKDVTHLQYLTSEQALADFATLVTELKESIFNTSSPVIVFGGSYGGMLAVWLRMKYPHVVEGAIAASAPIWYFSGLTPCNSAFVTITRDFEGASVSCKDNIRRSWEAIKAVGSQGGGLEWLTKTFRLCQPLPSSSGVSKLTAWIQDTWFNLAMVDYPYPADFLEPLPAWPINKTCASLSSEIDDDHKLLEAISSALMVYYNSTGDTYCLNISQDATASLGARGWNFQACTEMVMPMCTDGVHDMFPAEAWNLTAYEMECEQQFGVKPDPYWVEVLYGGKDISAHSNIVFSNGKLDPWSGGGVLQSISDSLVAVVIPNGAHHLDLRAATPNDPEDVKSARELEQEHISMWLKQYPQ